MIQERSQKFWQNAPNSQVVQVIGKKIVLYKEGKKEKKKIQLPK